MNYHMNKIDNTLPELLNILVTAEGTLKGSGVQFWLRSGLLLRKNFFQEEEEAYEETKEWDQAQEGGSKEGQR